MARRLLPHLAVWIAAVAMTAVTSLESIGRYRAFQSGWAWDLAYNNQWYWALVEGDQTLSIRPINSWGNEGPSIWVRTHLDPFRVLFVPIYALAPGPITLLVLHNILLWCLIPATFGLVRSETDSTGLALAAALLVPLTPLLGPLALNDFREMTLALPFVLWGIQGYRQRHRGLTALAIAGMLLSREEYGVMVASMALVPPMRDEDIGRTCRWARAVVALGIGWVVFGFFGYQDLVVSRNASEHFMKHMGGARTPLAMTAETAGEFLLVGCGSWSVLALFAPPRVAVLILPWLLGISNGRWDLEFLTDWRWHHVRYTAPMVATTLAAGAIGFGRLGLWALKRPGGRGIVAAVWVAAALGLLAGKMKLDADLARVEPSMSLAEAAEVWKWIDRVGSDDGVLASYEVSAPLSSRRLLYSNVMDDNKPDGYPTLGPEIRWIFLPTGDLDLGKLADPSFELVHRGEAMTIYRRRLRPS